MRRFGCTVTLRIADPVVETNVGYLPWVLGENLAGQVDAWVMENGLGYYPALAFFRDRPDAVDPALLALLDEVARFCVEYSRRELARRLRSAFAVVDVRDARCTAYTLPHVRPSRDAAPANLARHYAPDSVKADLVLTPGRSASRLEQAHLPGLLGQWLGSAFASVKVSGAHEPRR